MVKAKHLAMAAAALALAMSGPAAAQVPDPYAQELARELGRAEMSLREAGFGVAAGPFADGLAQGRTARFQVTLRAGQDYRVVGFCARCEGLQLRLYDAGDMLVRENVYAGAGPVLDVRPAMTGPYVIEARMGRCEGPECYFAFNIFSR